MKQDDVQLACFVTDRYDDTQERIAELKRRLARTDKLIATYQEYKDV